MSVKSTCDHAARVGTTLLPIDELTGAHPSGDRAKAALWRSLRRGKPAAKSVAGNGRA